MADNQKYYYLKLKDNFFDSEEMIILQNMPDGYLYSDILLKLYLRSLKNNGKLMFKDVIPYTPTVLAQVVRHQIGTVEKALRIFEDLGLVEILETGAIYMLDIQNFIGESSTEADRKRAYRLEIDAQKSNGSLIGTNVRQMSDKYPPEIEIELELKKDIEKDKEPKETLFERFWQAYPKKRSKGDAEKAFKQMKVNAELLDEILTAINNQKQCKDWKKESGKFIPYPASWLRAKGWEDETEVNTQAEYEDDLSFIPN